MDLKIDDFKPCLSEDQSKEVMQYENIISETIEKIMKGLKIYVEKHKDLSNKELAKQIEHKAVKNVVFKIRNNITFNTLELYRNKDEFLKFIL